MTITQDNMSLWDRLQYTEQSATKKVTGGKIPGALDINPTWRMKRMTEMFGPMGKGWGWELNEKWIDEIEGKKFAYVMLTVWWSEDGGKTRYLVGPHVGGTSMSMAKDEAWKQSITDAFGKCASGLGVAADIYEGKWDDSKYQNVQDAEAYRQKASATVAAQRNPNLQPSAIEKYEADLKEKLDGVADLDALDVLWREGVSARVREIGSVDKAAQNRMISIFSQKKNELLKNEETPVLPAKKSA